MIRSYRNPQQNFTEPTRRGEMLRTQTFNQPSTVPIGIADREILGTFDQQL